MKIDDVTLKKHKFPTDLEVFIRNTELLDFILTVTVLERPLSSSQGTVIVKCLLDNCLCVIEKAVL